MSKTRTWIIVGFDHPSQKHSLLYKKELSDTALVEALVEGVNKGCNIFSIRGFVEYKK